MTDSTRPATTEEFEIVDERRVDYFQLDNEIIDSYLARMGPDAFAVYATLVRWLYSRPYVRQSLSELEKSTGRSRPTVIKAVETLTSEEIKLVRRERQTDKHGNPAPNVYRLLRVPKKHAQEDGHKDKNDNNNKTPPPSSEAKAPAPSAPPSPPAPGAELVLLDTDAQIVQRLLEKNGVTVANARRFVAPDPEGKTVPRPSDYTGTHLDWLREQIACLPFRAKPGETVRNTGVVLTRAITNGYALPARYLTHKAEAQAKRARRDHQTQGQIRSGPAPDADADPNVQAAFAAARHKTRPHAQQEVQP